MKFLKPKLTFKVLVSVLVISIFTLFFAASISYKQIQTLTESENSVVHTYKIFAELEQLNLYAKEAESSQRGYILTKDTSFLVPYDSALTNINKALTSLIVLTSVDIQQSKTLDSIVYLINKRFTPQVNNTIIDDFGVNSPDSLKEFIRNGRDLMTLTQTQIDKMIAADMQLLKKHEMKQQNDIKLSPFSMLFIVVFSLFVFIVSFYEINEHLKGLAKTNNQLLINNEIFEHSEQIADISHWNWNIKENKLDYSDNLYRLLGCSENEFEPTFENFLKFVHPDDRHLILEENQKAVNELAPTLTYYRIIKKNGDIRHFKSIGKIITDNYGTTFSIGINADITEQYLKDKLIQEKLNDLERSNKQLSAFNHVASHDLQEPLRKVRTFISRIREKDLDTIPDKVKEYLTGIEKATYRMQRFIEDLLLYSRASKADKTFEWTDLNEILENSKRDLSQRIEEKNVVIHSSSDLPTINAIPFQIQQLFINILSNSIKYSRSGIDPAIDVKSHIVIGKDIPSFKGDADKRFYKISFSDNGIGFEQQYAENIFTLFYRLHTNSEYSGTGIGLAICKIITENHKGFISAEGNPDVGSVFNVYLPV